MNEEIAFNKPLEKSLANDLLFGIANEVIEPIVLMLSDDFLIRNINSSGAQEFFQKERDELCGLSIIDLFTKLGINPHPLLEAFRACGDSFHQTLKIEHELLRKEYSLTILATQDQGKTSYALTMVASTGPFQILKSYVNTIINNMPGAVYWKDKEGRYMGCNKFVAQMAGFESPEEMVGKTDYDLCWHEFAEDWRLLDNKVIQEDTTIVREEKAKLNSGKVITELTFKTPLKNEYNEIIGIIGTSLDITDRKEMELALVQSQIAAEAANRAKSEFIANMSHDIRTPLGGVVGMSRILEDSIDAPKERQYARWINDCGQQLLNLLNEILDVISTDTINENDLSYGVCDLAQCMQDIAQLELPTIKLKNLDLALEIDEDIPQYLITDQTKLHRILLNLLGNAIKFTEKGHVGVKVKLIEHCDDSVKLRFSVFDTGIGISEAVQGRIFDQFFRADPSYKGLYKGNGIGLHIAQSYTRLLGGEIKLNSVVDEGTTFYFDLTLNIASVDQPSSPVLLPCKGEGSPIRQAQESPMLLLIEDNPIALQMIKIAATQAGCRYMATEDAESAFALVQSTAFDIIITDIGLPGMSGDELTRSIREWEQLNDKPSIPIIGLTAHVSKAEAEYCRQSGMNQVLIKPVTVNMLQRIVDEFMGTDVESPSVINPGLGVDLPLTEPELLMLDQFPLLDIEDGLKILGSKKVLVDMLTLLLNECIEKETQLIIEAYSSQDWDSIEKLAHKMKGGAAYCGTVKMYKACQYMERYHKAGHSKSLLALYRQLLRVITETKLIISRWLLENRD